MQGEEHELYHTAKFRTTPLPAGGRPTPLSEVAARQVKGARHSGKQLDDLPSVQILDASMPQVVGTALDFFRSLVLPVAEQVVAVPKISFDCISQRLVERRLQLTRAAYEDLDAADEPAEMEDDEEPLIEEEEDPSDWFVAPSASGRPFFWHRISRRSVWKLTPGAS